MAKSNAALCFLFMLVMAYSVQQSEGTIVLKSLALIHLLKKLHVKKAVVTHPTVVQPPYYSPKPIYPKRTAPYGCDPVTGRCDCPGNDCPGGRRLLGV